ncbi:MAG: GspH/FimT family pseudopilin [Desulfobacterales bacterium]|nr:GspH/FimT family pseudopilin [Desulfobacterales bacterium]
MIYIAYKDKWLSHKTSMGLTMVELLITVAIISILVAMASPEIQRLLPDYRLKSAAREIMSDLQLAKLSAIRRNEICVMTFDVANSSYKVFIDLNDNYHYDTGDTLVRELNLDQFINVDFDLTQGGGDGITFTPNNSGDPHIAFRPNGIPRSYNAGFSQGSVFLVNSNQKHYRVIVSLAGNIRIQVN